jgi:NADH:ubiquinone oxidoreductase subunit F (NADH-binding)
MGMSLRNIIEDIGGGVPNKRKFKAAQTGGPSGGCLPARYLDLPIDYESLASVGSIVGSGGLIVMDDRTCMVDIARYFLNFTRDESCGKCVPCRMGTQHLLRILTDICEGRGVPEQIQQLKAIADTVKKGSLCGLGQTCPNPVLTTLRYFEDEYRAHVVDRKCPAGVCRALISFSIDQAACTGCGACLRACPAEAISGEKKKPHQIDKERCIRCGSCRTACKFESIILD